MHRNILREHKLLPKKMQDIGNSYVKNEFKLHQNTKNEEHIKQFMNNWNKYLQDLQNRRLNDKKFGAMLDEDLKSKLNSEQAEKLEHLKNEIKKSMT